MTEPLRLGCQLCGHLYPTLGDLMAHGRRAHGTPKVQIAIDCPYCGEAAHFMPSSRPIYNGSEYGPVWRCDACDAHVGCHRGSNRPLGRLANKALREAKQAAHAAFDPVWQQFGVRRRDAYKLLADRLGIEFKRCHIGQMDLPMCQRVVKEAAAIKLTLAQQQGATPS